MARGRSARSRDSERQRAADYSRALARLRDLHRDEFEAIYAEERTQQQHATNDTAGR